MHEDEIQEFPDLGALSDAELKSLVREYEADEARLSYRRRLLQGKIDILRAENVNRLRKHHQGEDA